jgi:wyosine [tRNA(Phe)-imidazoG37] synthetase (radical SAM superfamily)
VPPQFQKQSSSGYTYGPVPSRRLGFSLGIDIVPHKNCSYDCIYCQLGKTIHRTTLRKKYAPTQEILHEVGDVLKKNQQIDFLTFSGSGEPTLHEDIGHMINELKKLTRIPIAVLTNGSLLHMPEVRNDLMNADLVIPTLCTADRDIYRRIHRGYEAIDIDMVIEGYIRFREMYRGQIWLELMLIRGINDKPEQIGDLKEVIDRINPDKIQLNTVVRPPSEEYARPVSLETMQKIKETLGEKCEIIVDLEPKTTTERHDDQLGKITATIARRPVTIDDLIKITGMSRAQVLKHIEVLTEMGIIEVSKHNKREYYRKAGGSDERTQGHE